jgi:hypothetical protein
MGPGEEVVGKSHDGDTGINNGKIGFLTSVKDLSFLFFCQQLVHHFPTMF